VQCAEDNKFGFRPDRTKSERRHNAAATKRIKLLHR
jgi:hypothetical protein